MTGGGMPARLARVERWLFAPARPERLAALRIGLSATLAARLALGSYAALSAQPAALFRPRSFMHLFPAMPPRPAVLALQVVGVLAAVLAALGIRARQALPLAWAAGLVLAGMTTSLGKVAHNDVLLLLAMVPLLPAPVSDAWALDRGVRGEAPGPSPRYGWPVRTAAVVVVGAYLFAGLAKLMDAGPAWAIGDNLRHLLYVSSDGGAVPNGVALFIADRPLLARAVATATLGMELTFPLALLGPGPAAAYVAGAAGLHLGIFLAMGLDYSAQAATVAVVLVDWPAVLGRLGRRRSLPAPSLTLEPWESGTTAR